MSLSLGACATAPAVPVGTVLGGEWGGAHVGLVQTPDHGDLSYDCAAGTIGPIVPDRAGRFEAAGVHLPGHGGPDRIDEVPVRKAVVYSGTVNGNRMTLSGVLDDGTRLGPFLLMRGAPPMLTRCL